MYGAMKIGRYDTNLTNWMNQRNSIIIMNFNHCNIIEGQRKTDEKPGNVVLNSGRDSRNRTTPLSLTSFKVI